MTMRSIGPWTMCGPRWLAAALLAIGLVVAPLAASRAHAVEGLPQIRKSPRDTEALRRNFVGIVTGGPTGVYAALGNDLLRLLDDRKAGTLRLAAMIGSGSINNLDDLWNLPGVSLAVVQGDVLSAYAADPDQFKWLNGNVRYVSRLHTEVLHVLVRRDAVSKGARTICALRGKRLNVGGLGSGAKITVDKLFNGLLGLGVTLDPASLNEAFDQLADGRVDALAYVVGRPAPVFADEKLARRFAGGSLDWLDAPRSLLDAGCDGRPPRDRQESAIYEGVTLTAADYPALIREGRTVDTIGVPAVLAAYRFEDHRNGRGAATATFVQQFFARAADPESGLGRPGGGYSHAWCGVDLALPVGGWQRDESAADWLAANGRAVSPMPTRIDCLSGPGGVPAFCRAKGELVTEFNRQQRVAGKSIDPGDPDYLMAFADWNRRTCR